jgi:HEAT repeat protein
MRVIVESAMQKDVSPFVRSIATRSVAQIAPMTAKPILVSALNGRDAFVAAAAAHALGRISNVDSLVILQEKAEQLLGDNPDDPATDSYVVLGALNGEPADPRTAILRSTVGALDELVGRLTKQDSTLDFPRLPELLVKALSYPAPVIRGTAASALGKLKYTPAWNALKVMVETPDTDDQDVRSMRASACYACDQIAREIAEPDIPSAAKFFSSKFTDRRESPPVRRSAISGAAKLARRGYAALDLCNDLLEAARDTDSLVARNAWYALVQLSPELIIDDCILLLAVLDSTQRQQVCDVAIASSTPVSLLVINWLIQHESKSNVLASALYAANRICKRAASNLGDSVNRVLANERFVETLASRIAEIIETDDPDVLSISLSVFVGLATLNSLKMTVGLVSLKSSVASRARVLLNHADEVVVQNACVTIATFGTFTDAALLAKLGESGKGKVLQAAQSAHSALMRRLSPT